MKISALDIAKVAHEVNRAYCAGIGDDSQVAWELAPQWQRDSMLAGVTAVLHGAAGTHEEQHEAWRTRKIEEGWTYGETKDAEQKTHPCLVPYTELPAAQHMKDYLSRAVILSLAN